MTGGGSGCQVCLNGRLWTNIDPTGFFYVYQTTCMPAFLCFFTTGSVALRAQWQNTTVPMTGTAIDGSQ